MKYIILAILLLPIKLKDEETKVFSNYLQIVHGVELTEEEHYYVIVNLNDCKSCIANIFHTLNNSSMKKNQTTVITSYIGRFYPIELKDIQINFRHLKESKGQFFKTSLGHYTNPIIKIKKKKICNIYEIKNKDDLKNIFCPSNKIIKRGYHKLK